MNPFGSGLRRVTQFYRCSSLSTLTLVAASLFVVLVVWGTSSRPSGDETLSPATIRSRARRSQTYRNESEALAAAASDATHVVGSAPPECKRWLSSTTLVPTFTSQFGQDATLYYNFWAGRLARGAAPGTFVDLGANEPKTLSNTWFLEKCLGWKGVCIEANPGLAEVLRRERSCTVVNMCVDPELKEVTFATTGSTGHIVPAGHNGGVTVRCAPLASVLQGAGVSHVDFLSIDIEGAELHALSDVDWDAVPIEMMLIESGWSSEELDMLMSDAGFWRVADMTYVDDLYVRRLPLLRPPTANRWRSENWEFFRGTEFNQRASRKRVWHVKK